MGHVNFNMAEFNKQLKGFQELCEATARTMNPPAEQPAETDSEVEQAKQGEPK